MNVVEAWLKDLWGALKEEPIAVSDIRIGVFYTAAQLATGYVGVAFTPRDLADTVCCPRSAAAAPPAGQMAGQDAWSLARYALSRVPLRRAVGVAVLNALSALALARHYLPGGQVLPGADALDVTGIVAEDRVAMVGAFVPFIKALKGQVADLCIVDKHRLALKADEIELWQPPAQATAVLARASVAIISGSALVEGGLDELLEAAGKCRKVVLAGPTASAWPPTFFARGVHVLGGIRVLNGHKMLQLVSEGGSGYFFTGAAEKICAIRESDFESSR